MAEFRIFVNTLQLVSSRGDTRRFNRGKNDVLREDDLIEWLFLKMIEMFQAIHGSLLFQNNRFWHSMIKLDKYLNITSTRGNLILLLISLKWSIANDIESVINSL